MVNTLTDGLAVGSTWRLRPMSGAMEIDSRLSERLTLWDGLFAVTPPDTDTVDEVALLGFVAEATGLVGAGRT